jgi:hypothetical protein
MSLIHPLLLSGLALTSIPVILHFLLRARPKQLLFPALRLIQNRRKLNVQRMRLRHVFLLLLRIGLVATVVFAVARPRVPVADYSLTVGEGLTLAILIAAGVGTYAALLRRWKKSRLPQHVFAHRRSFLRGGIGAATLLLALLLVAWPYQRRIGASMSGPMPNLTEHVPVAGVFVFDSSLSMEYRHESRSRLDVAKEIATHHISRLPSGSRLAIADSATDNPVQFLPDLNAAQSRIESLAIKPVSVALNDRLFTALELQRDDQQQAAIAAGSDSSLSDSFVREIYIFTDLTQSAWRREDSSRLQTVLTELPQVAVYLIDVGVDEPKNVGITQLKLSDQTLSLGSDLTVHATVTSTGVSNEEKILELYIENDAGKLVKQAQAIAKVEAGSAAVVTFSPAKNLGGPVRQGEVRLLASDPLAADNVRFFTIEVRQPLDILVVTDQPNEARYFVEALAPAEFVKLGKAKYRCKVVTPNRLLGEKLEQFAAVCLLNVASPTRDVWDSLAKFADAGGGVAIVLGERVDSVAYNSAAAKALLPGELLAKLKFNPPEFFDLQKFTHPVLKYFADWQEGAGELSAVEIQRYWRVAPSDPDAVVVRFTDLRTAPAILDRPHGAGRVVMLTTAFHRTREPTENWNDLPVVPSGLVLVDQIVKHLTRRGESSWNLTAGETVVVPLDRGASGDEKFDPRLLLRKPEKQQLRIDVAADATSLTVRDADQLGNYRVLAADAASPFQRGFSVNPPESESRLDRLTDPDLEKLLGKDRFAVARNIDSLTRSVHTGRLGREVYPLVVLFLIAVFATEHFVANRFYDEDRGSPPS